MVLQIATRVKIKTFSTPKQAYFAYSGVYTFGRIRINVYLCT